jgi:hypothetical protein
MRLLVLALGLWLVWLTLASAWFAWLGWCGGDYESFPVWLGNYDLTYAMLGLNPSACHAWFVWCGGN